jgi:hypothetical protein
MAAWFYVGTTLVVVSLVSAAKRCGNIGSDGPGTVVLFFSHLINKSLILRRPNCKEYEQFSLPLMIGRDRSLV